MASSGFSGSIPVAQMDISEGIGEWSGAAATAPPTVLMATSESGSVVCIDGAAGDDDTVSTSVGPRGRGKKRGWKNGVGNDSRAYVPGRISPLEDALQHYGDRGTGSIIVPRVGMEFDSCTEAFDFYNLYSWEVGFGIRYCRSQCYKKHGAVYRNMQLIVCNCGGRAGDEVSYSIKQGCPSFMQLLRTDDDGWYIKEFCADHNHSLSETCGEKKCWKSHNQIDPHTKDLIRTLRMNNVSLIKVYSIVTSFFGNNSASPITKMALRNLCGQISRENAEDDVRKTIEVFNKMHEEDAGFAHVVDMDNEGKIKTLMWTNGKSRHDYLCFGDAVTFDTTYKTNKYNMPFGLFVGVNNHYQSIIFAGVLMRDETIPSFEWVFTKFVSLMGGKEPKTILTDQCRAMEVTLANKLPNVTHRWCKWHVFRTIKQELGTVYTKDFKKELNKICNYMFTPDEFETGWIDLMKSYGLENHAFLENIFNNRFKWAKAFFSDKFCAKQTSTQRSESANHVLKRFIPPGAPMHLFVQQYQKLLVEWNEQEDRKVHEDKKPLKKSATGWPLEKHAAEFYTKTMLEMFVGHIKAAASYDVEVCTPGQKYRLVHVDASTREKWSRGMYEVEITQAGTYYCECGLYEHMGMLCCHSIRVMMHLMVRQIPEAQLLQRWSRNARKVVLGSQYQYSMSSSLHMSRTFRNVSLTGKARELVDLGDLNIECYDLVNQSICELIDKVKSKRPKPDGLGLQAQLQMCQELQPCEDSHNHSTGTAEAQLHVGAKPPDSNRKAGRPTNARDRPPYEKRKQLSTRIKRCKSCRQTGHNSDQCPNRDTNVDKPKQQSRCTRCRMPGHTRVTYGRLNGNVGL